MTRFTDGPAKGQALSLARSPQFLRVVCAGDKWDALDQLDDTPRPGESIWVYVCSEVLGTCHISYRDEAGRRRGRWEQIVKYRLYEVQPDDATLRDTTQWRAWCLAEQAKLKAKGAG